MLTNATGEENPKTKEQLYCSAELTERVHIHLIFLAVINIFLSITAFLGNTLILVALRKESSLHRPSKLLYRNLAITDLCVGIIVGPFSAAYWISEAMERWDICFYALHLSSMISSVLCVVSLLTLTAISIDRVLALLLGLRYRQIVTLKKTYVVMLIFWVCSIVAATMYIVNTLVTSWWANMVTFLCLVTSIFSYTKIFLTLRYNSIQPQEQISQAQSTQATPLNMARYRKAVSSALWIQVTLVVCYLPYAVAVFLTPQGKLTLHNYLSRQFGFTVICLNSSLNPLLYCWKIKEVRQAVKQVKDTLRQICCSLV